LIFCSAFGLVESARAQSVSPGKFTKEPEVRIGILQKATHTSLKFAGSYHAFKSAGQSEMKEFRSGKGESFQIELYTVRLRQLPHRYRVSLGAYRSFEQAQYTLNKLGKIPFKAAIAQPKQWSIWFGPFNSMDEAKYAQNYAREKGFRDSRIEPESTDIAILTLYTNGSSLIHVGTGPVVFYPSNGRFILNSREYRGNVEFAPDPYGTFNVINLVKADDYLLSVLPREMPSGAAMESLKAQAVIARTYLLNNLPRHEIDNFNLCATSDCQVYGGVNDEVASTNEAVKRTRGEALVYQGKLANALFHSTCGGRTADYNDNWSGDGPDYLISVDDGSGFDQPDLSSADKVEAFLDQKTGNCSASKYFRWEKKFTAAELLDVVKLSIPEFTNNPDLKIGAVNNIAVTEYSKSGRAQKLAVSTDAGDFVFEKDAIRWVLGNLKSIFFVIETNGANGGREYTFRGAGWGHGVGLCQIGAMKLGKDGSSYTKILDHYYPETSLVTLWK
jgi:SpoIID/LytB domain protein